jgi:acyl-CoA synthetase (AMP-forming)/AMP-acid ligase II
MDAELTQAVLSRAVGAQAAHNAGRLVFVFENGPLPAEPVTTGDLAVRGNQIAWALHQRGLRRGDRVAIMLRNHPEFVYGLVAASKLGLPVVPVDPRSPPERLGACLEAAECGALLTADHVVADPAAAEVIRQAGLPTWVLSTPEGRAEGLDPSGAWPVLNEALDGAERADVGEHVDDLAAPWLLAFTPGVTGRPRAVEFPHERLVLYRRVPRLFGYRGEDIPYTGLSLTRGNALLVTMLPAVWGAVHHAVLSRTFTKSRLWDVCIDHGCTTWSSLGGIAAAVYREPTSTRDRAHRVRLVVSVGMPREIWRPFEERFGVRVLEWYGTMEGGFAYNPVGVGPVGSFGKPPEGLIEMEVLGEDGRPVVPGRIGELVVRPAGGEARLSYFKDPEGSAGKVRRGWLHTGDMVTRDEAGWLSFAFHHEGGPDLTPVPVRERVRATRDGPEGWS